MSKSEFLHGHEPGYEVEFSSINSSAVTDEDSSAYLDRLDLADAYDDEDAGHKDSDQFVGATDQSLQGIKQADIVNVHQTFTTSISSNGGTEPVLEEDGETEVSSDRFQYMITEHMRSVLLNELGYSKFEV
jgi:hypothetical protein